MQQELLLNILGDLIGDSRLVFVIIVTNMIIIITAVSHAHINISPRGKTPP